MAFSLCQDQLFKAASYFINLNKTDISFVDGTKKDAKFEDSLIKIDYVPIFPDQSAMQCSNSTETMHIMKSQEDSVDNLHEETKERRLYFFCKLTFAKNTNFKFSQLSQNERKLAPRQVHA